MLFKLSILKFPAESASELIKRSLVLDRDYFVVGRSDTCDLVLLDNTRMISREHFSLKKQGQNWLLTVVSATNSVQINHREVGASDKHILEEGEHIFLGTYELLFERVLDESKTIFPMEAPKAQEQFPFPELDNNATSVSTAHIDPFGFISCIEPQANPILVTTDLMPSTVVDVFGLDNPKELSTSNLLEVDPFDFINGVEPNISSQGIVEPKSSAIHIFGLDNDKSNSIPKEFTNSIDVSLVHTHPINESISQHAIIPVVNAYDGTLNSQLTDAETKRLLIEALGLDYERFATIDEKELINKVGFLLSKSLGIIIDLLRLRSATKLEVGTIATTLAVNNNNPLKYSPNSVVALGYLLNKPQLGFMPHQESIKEAKEDLLSYNKDLLNVTQKLGKYILKELSPVTIETNLTAKGGFSLKIPVQREAKLWTEYKKLHESCDENLDQIIKKVF